MCLSSSLMRKEGSREDARLAGTPMRALAAVYLFFALLDLVVWAANAGSVNATPGLYLSWTWAMYAASLLAVLAILINTSIFPKRLWVFIAGAYLLTRLLELVFIGLPLTQTASTNIYVILRFAWIAGMPALSMLLLATHNRNTSAPLTRDNSKHSIDANAKHVTWDNWMP